MMGIPVSKEIINYEWARCQLTLFYINSGMDDSIAHEWCRAHVDAIGYKEFIELFLEIFKETV